jgi:hypothetical protein
MSGRTELLGTLWTHKKKGGVYRLTQVSPKKSEVYLEAQTKGRRSTWKAECLLTWDYDPVSGGGFNVQS